MKKSLLFIGILLLLLEPHSYGQKITIDRNKASRKEWFRDLGFVMFIHWSVDVQLGAIIRHNVAV